MLRPRAIWFVGLPGSGKSTIARAVLQALRQQWAARGGPEPVLLEMDARRKVYFPEPCYTAEERAKAYDLFVDEACQLVEAGRLVLLDGCAHKRSMRDHARKTIPGFAEVCVRCPLDKAMAREAGRLRGKVMADLYAKALERKATGRHFPGLGQVVGVDVPFEEDPGAELTLDSDRLSPEQARDMVLAWLDARDT